MRFDAALEESEYCARLLRRRDRTRLVDCSTGTLTVIHKRIRCLAPTVHQPAEPGWDRGQASNYILPIKKILVT